MGHKTTRPNGQRYHAKSLTIREVPTGDHFLVLGSLDEDALRSHACQQGYELGGRSVTVGWWVLSRGVPRVWEYDDDRGEPGILVSP